MNNGRKSEEVKKLEEAIKVLKRQNLELTRVYEERGRQIERLEVGLTRALEGIK